MTTDDLCKRLNELADDNEVDAVNVSASVTAALRTAAARLEAQVEEIERLTGERNTARADLLRHRQASAERADCLATEIEALREDLTEADQRATTAERARDEAMALLRDTGRDLEGWFGGDYPAEVAAIVSRIDTLLPKRPEASDGE